MLKATIKSLLAHKLRFLLSAVAILLGVTFVSGTYAFTDTMNDVFQTMVEEGVANVDVYVQPKTAFEGTTDYGTASPGFPRFVLSMVENTPGVAAAEGTVAGYAQFVDKQGAAITPIGPPTIGMSWNDDEALSTLEIVEGRAPAGPEQVTMDRVTAEKYGFQVGDRVKILLQGPQRTFELVGIFDQEGDATFGGATLAAFDQLTAQAVLDKTGRFDAIEVAAEDGVTARELSMRLEDRLPSKVEAVTAQSMLDEQKRLIEQNMGFFTTALLVFAAISVFVGAFIIFNTFSITVAQRVQEYGLLRAIGATGRQVSASVISEAVVVGLIASVLGIFGGLGAAKALQGLMDAIGFDLPATTPRLEMRTIVVSLVVGIGVTVFAAVIPARRAAKVPPVQAMQKAGTEVERSRRVRLIAGSVMAIAGVALVLSGLYLDVSDELSFVGAGAALSFLAMAMFAPLLARPVSMALGAPLPRFFGVTGALARGNSARSPRRTAATASALMVGLGVVVMVAVFAASLKSSMTATTTRSFTGDLVVMPKGTLSMQTFSPRIAEDIEALPEIELAAPYRFGEWENDAGARRMILAVDPERIDRVMDLDVASGSTADLSDGGIMIHRSVAEEENLAVGDELDMTFPATPEGVSVRIDGIFEAPIDDKYLLSLATYEENFPKQQDVQIHVIKAAGASLGEAEGAIDELLSAYPNVDVMGREEYIGEMGAFVDQLVNMIFALLGLTLLIAMMGITNTLALSIHERTKELGLLRAVGATKGQVRKMIRWEAAIIAIFGSALGLFIGSLLAFALVSALKDEGLSQITFPIVQLALFVAIAVVAGLISAVMPARRAARVDVLRAVAFE